MYKAIPAYGRYRTSTYQSIARDWQEGKDFQLINGPYFSIRDFDSMKNDLIDKVLQGDKPVISIYFLDTGLDFTRVVEIYDNKEIVFTT